MQKNQKVVLITGISGGLGSAIAQEWIKKGFLVAGISRTSPKNFTPHWFFAGDLTQKETAHKAIEEFQKQFNHLDVLINNAGIGVYDPWEEVEEENLYYEMELNFFAVVRLTKKALPLLKEKQGTIINISSVAGKLAMPYMGAYSASKFALDAYTQSLRAELRQAKVKVLGVSPGRISTGFGKNVIGKVKSPSTFAKASAPHFAKKLFKTYQKQKREWIYPRWYRFFIAFGKTFSRLFDILSVKKWKKAQKT